MGGLVMRRSILTFVLAAMSVCLMPVHFPAAGVIAAAPNHDVAQITAGPELEIVNDTLAIIRWTTTNPGRTDLHYGIVHYGTDAKNLSELAKSPNRRNPSRPDMIFRVRITGLKPQTTYYYTVESTSATGVNDGVSSPIRTFKTR
jgi:phosphodiesterase/alkaline phosphatase D-like protein